MAQESWNLTSYGKNRKTEKQKVGKRKLQTKEGVREWNIKEAYAIVKPPKFLFVHGKIIYIQNNSMQPNRTCEFIKRLWIWIIYRSINEANNLCNTKLLRDMQWHNWDGAGAWLQQWFSLFICFRWHFISIISKISSFHHTSLCWRLQDNFLYCFWYFNTFTRVSRLYSQDTIYI